jgi:hypothetical protein
MVRIVAQIGAELARVVTAARKVEKARRDGSLHTAVAAARQMSFGMERRSTRERVTLRRLILIVDRLFPGGPNCVRRSLVEMALDLGAAEEDFLAGLTSGGGFRSGHAWLSSHQVDRQFHAVFRL